MKRAFTLIEIVMTLAIIALVLSMVTHMGRGFSDRVRFANTKEEVSYAITNIVQHAATSNSVAVGTGQKRYGTILLTLPLSGNLVEWSYASGELAEAASGYATITNGTISTSGYSIMLKPYGIGCEIGSGGFFTVVSNLNKDLKACFETIAATCKLREVQCN